jgi:hypothetical protein
MKLLFYILFLVICSCSLLSQTLNGTYQIGIEGDYTNISSALNSAFSQGVSGPVVLELTSSYNSSNEVYPVRIKNIPGLSAINQLTIRPSSKSGEIILSSSNAQTILFEGCSYVIIDGQSKIVVQHTQTNMPILFLNDASNNILRGLTIRGKANPLITIGPGIVTGCNYNKIISCTITGLSASEYPYSGIYVYGNQVPNTGTLIDSCKFENFRDMGIYLPQKNENTIIRNCSFYQTQPVNSSNISAIRYESDTKNLEIYNNKIYGFASTSSSYTELNGIYAAYDTSSNASTSRIYNNFISLNYDNQAAEASISGIKFKGKRGTRLEAYHNTIIISGDDNYGRSSFCINKQGMASEFIIYNNILVNQRLTLACPGKQYCFYAPDPSGIISDYNNFHNGIIPPFVGHWEGIDLYIIEDWINISKKDSSSTFKEVNFVSSTNLHLAGSSLGDYDLTGWSGIDVFFDIDGELRNQGYPYKGADENLQYPLPVEIESFSGSITGMSVLLSWITAAEINNYGFTIERRGDKDWEQTGFVPGKNTTTEKNYYSFIDEPGYGTFYYRLRQTDFNGDFSYTNEIKFEIKDNIEFIVLQNYPNPFNPSTTISFSLPDKGVTTLKIYDITGQLVEILLNSELDKGTYTYQFKGNNLSGGIYFYEIVSGGKRFINKMSLVK